MTFLAVHKVVETRKVLVGIEIDSHSRQLLNWALVKVAEPGDCVIAIHVVRNPDHVSKSKLLLENYLDVYEGLCNVKKVNLTGKIFTGSKIRSILVREAKNHAALALVVGTSKHSLGRRASTAKYCAKRLPPTINVLAIQDGKIFFRRCTSNQLTGLIQDPRPSLSCIDSRSEKEIPPEYGDSEADAEESILEAEVTMNLKAETFNGKGRSTNLSLRSMSLFIGDPSEHKLGWPLLRRASSGTPTTLHAREMSVVQWVMSLPDRSPRKCPCSSFMEENPTETSLSDIEDVSPKNLDGILNINSSNCKWFSLEALKSWTCEFSSGNLIGKGGSNRVFRGVLPNLKPIAVKVLKSSKEAWKDFALEVEIITSLNHKSITPLLGLCIEDNSLISVYDFFHKGSLEENLHGKSKDGCILPWEARFSIAVGIAEALNYLHNETLKPVIHRDVKSSNILLSRGFKPHLSDFGLAIWGPTTSSFLTQEDVVGTFGYLAPEYFMYGKVSDKIDVYAFGVVVLELITGRKAISPETSKAQQSLVVWAKPLMENGDLIGLLDPNLQGKFDEIQLHRMVLAASLCTTRAARLRPKMNQILNILKGDEKVEHLLNSNGYDHQYSANQDNIDDEVYPNSSAELHLSLALLDVDDETTSSSSTDQSSSLSLEQQLKERSSRSSSFN
ncbi:hypothetical protein L6164_004742 [Bauhinia variegata]|uniref:Uncharacterized protein n=1 Tax=Bauhinia variegata TaxID=167791 RepID=A0ACB9PPB0_BAUVA|nr:hypothetical protein L6164_004742 [Bauhinia variegata]